MEMCFRDGDGELQRWKCGIDVASHFETFLIFFDRLCFEGSYNVIHVFGGDHMCFVLPDWIYMLFFLVSGYM